MADSTLILLNDPSQGHLALKANGQVATTFQDATDASRPQWAPVTDLQSNPSTNVTIIGGGFMGLSTAIALAQKAQEEGRPISISLLEAKQIGFGASGRSGGHIDGALEPPDEMLTESTSHVRGLEKKLTKLGEGGPANVRAVINRYGINCNLGNGYMYMDHSNDGHRVYDYRGNLTNLEPYPYVQGLAAVARSLGVKIYENAPVSNITSTADGRFAVETAHGTVTAGHIVAAAGPTTETIPFFRDIARSRAVNLPVSTIITPPLPEKVRIAILGTAGKKMLAGAEEENPNEDVAFWHFDQREQRMIFGVGISTTSRVNATAIAKEMDRIFPNLRAAYRKETGQTLPGKFIPKTRISITAPVGCRMWRRFPWIMQAA